MSDTLDPVGKLPKDRSPSFPYIGLSKAFERTEQLFGFTKRHEVRIADAAKPAWVMAAKSSSTLQTVAALLAYGLIEDSGSGDGRKIKVTDLAYRALGDMRPGVKEAALAEAAMKPKLLAEYIEKWGHDRPPVETCLSELTFDRNFTPQGARAFIRVFDDTVRFALPQTSVMFSGQGSDYARENGDTDSELSDATREHPTAVGQASGDSAKVRLGEELDRFTVDEGVVKIIFPSDMSADSVEELELFLNLFIKKAKRRAGSA